MGMMMNNWDSLKQKSFRSLALYFAAIGAIAGVASWALVTLVQVAFGSAGPSLMTLLWAVIRGAIFAIIFAVILYVLGRKNSRSNK